MADGVDESLSVGRLELSADALGRVLDLLAGVEPFSHYELGSAVRAVREQMRQGACVAAADAEGRLVGYAGWIYTTRSIGKLWVTGMGPLKPVEPPSDATALTIVVSESSRATRELIRAARRLNPGSEVFFKRSYDADPRGLKRVSVRNWVGE